VDVIVRLGKVKALYSSVLSTCLCMFFDVRPCFTLGEVLLATANHALEDVDALVGSMSVTLSRFSCYVQTPEVTLISKRSIGIRWNLHRSDRHRTPTV
jgi:hypothetical protein